MKQRYHDSTFYHFIVEPTQIYDSTEATNAGTRFHHLMVAVTLTAKVGSIEYEIWNFVFVILY